MYWLIELDKQIQMGLSVGYSIAWFIPLIKYLW